MGATFEELEHVRRQRSVGDILAARVTALDKQPPVAFIQVDDLGGLVQLWP